MNFLENIFNQLSRSPERAVMLELRPSGNISATAAELLNRIAGAREFLQAAGLRKGDRCALIAPNGITWAAFDLAAMADGIIVVPLYLDKRPRNS